MITAGSSHGDKGRPVTKALQAKFGYAGFPGFSLETSDSTWTGCPSLPIDTSGLKHLQVPQVFPFIFHEVMMNSLTQAGPPPVQQPCLWHNESHDYWQLDHESIYHIWWHGSFVFGPLISQTCGQTFSTFTVTLNCAKLLSNSIPTIVFLCQVWYKSRFLLVELLLILQTPLT